MDSHHARCKNGVWQGALPVRICFDGVRSLDCSCDHPAFPADRALFEVDHISNVDKCHHQRDCNSSCVKRAIDGKPFNWDKLERTAKMPTQVEKVAEHR